MLTKPIFLSNTHGNKGYLLEKGRSALGAPLFSPITDNDTYHVGSGGQNNTVESNPPRTVHFIAFPLCNQL